MKSLYKTTIIMAFMIVLTSAGAFSEELNSAATLDDGWLVLSETELTNEQWGCSVDCPEAYMCASSYNDLPCRYYNWFGVPFCMGYSKTGYLTFDACIQGSKTTCNRTLGTGGCYFYTDCVLNATKTGCLTSSYWVGSRYICTSS